MHSYVRRARKALANVRKAYSKRRLSAIAERNDFDPGEALMIFSDPRGGSTWITEMVQQIPRTAVVWEPLNLNSTDAFRKIGFGWRQYIPEDAEWEEARGTFEQLLRGRLLNESRHNLLSMDLHRQADRLIVKVCRGNALLPWLTRQFTFRHKPIYLIRHPFAVVASQLRFGAWDKTFGGFSIPKGRYNDLYTPHADFLQRIETKEEALVATWCLTNLVPLRHPKNNVDWITVNYETLLLQPERTLERIFGVWNMPLPSGALDQVRQASDTTRDATFQISLEAQLRKWQEQFSDDQIRRMTSVLDYFEVEFYDTGVKPLVTF